MPDAVNQSMTSPVVNTNKSTVRLYGILSARKTEVTETSFHLFTNVIQKNVGLRYLMNSNSVIFQTASVK